MTALSSSLLLLLAALAFVFVFVVARHFPHPAAEGAAGTGAPRQAIPSPSASRSQRRRARALIGRSFREMLAFLHSVIPGRQYAYTLPWFLLIGESGAGKTTLLDSVERTTGFSVKPPRMIAHPGLCEWRFFDIGAVLDVNGAIVPPRGDGLPADESGWDELLSLLRNYRPLRPLDGIVLTIPCESLTAGESFGRDALATKADDLYRRMWTIQQHLGLRLPVYLVLTKGDRIPGFESFAQALAPLQKLGIFGWSNPGEPDAPLRPQLAATAFADIAARLRRIYLDIAADTDDPIDSDGLLVFPGAVQRLAGPLQMILNSLFRPSAFQEPFFLRGIYLAGFADATEQAAGVPREPDLERFGAGSDGPSAALAPAASATMQTPVFVHDLFGEKIFAETALAAVAQHGRVRQARNVRMAQIALALLVIILGTGLTFETVRLERGIDSLLPAFAAVNEGLASLTQGRPVPANNQTGANRFPGAEAFLSGLADIDLNGLRSPFLPTSWFSNLESDAVNFLQAGFTQVLLPTMRHELSDRVQAALANLAVPAGNAASSTSAFAMVGSSDFSRLDTSVRALILLQSEAELFNQVNSRPEPRLIGRLSNDLLGIKAPPSFYQNAGLYQMALSRSHVTPYDFAPIIPRAREAVLAAFRPMEARLSDTGPILAGFADLPQAFTNLEAAPRGGIDPGAATDALIAALARTKRMLDDPKLAWITSKSVKDIPELDRLLTVMSRSPVFGPDLADSLRSRVESDLRTLQERLAAVSATAIGPILDQANGQITLKFASPIARLADRLSAMLKYGFMAPRPDGGSALAGNSGREVRWDVDTLHTALDFYRDYERFEANELDAMPKALTKPLDEFARQRLQASMIKAVTGAMSTAADASNGAALDEGVVFNQAENFGRAAPVLGDILSVSNQLGFADYYEKLRSLTTDQAYGLLEQVDQLAERDRLYLPQGDFAGLTGDTTALQAAYRLHSDVEVAQYLDSQRVRVARLAHGGAEPVLGFLGRSDIAGATSSMPLIGKWRGILVALQSYQNGNSGGSIGALEDFIRFTLAAASRSNCPIRSGAGERLVAADFFGQRLEMLRREAAAVCNHATVATTVSEYDQLATLFSRLLAGRYPFAPAGAAPVELSGVATFFEAFSTQEAPVRASLAKSANLPGTQDAIYFLDQLDKVSAFFAPLLAPPTGEKSGGYDVNVAFRVNRRHEHGADQIIDWRITVGDTVVRGDHPTARWFLGDPITVRLRWAKDSPLTPDAREKGPQVDGRTAIFAVNGRWALIKLLREHLAAPDEADPGSADAVPHLLKFTIPVSVPNTERAKPVTPEDQVIAYIRISLTAPGATGPKAAALVLPDFPEQAPDLSAGRSRMLFPEATPKLSSYPGASR